MRYYIKIGEYTLPTLVAETPEQQAKGLMYYKKPQPLMSFPYKKAQMNKFWMKNCPDDLDIVFAFNGKINDIKHGVAHSTSMMGTYPSDLVVELPYGTVEKLGVKIGDSIKLFNETLFRQ